MKVYAVIGANYGDEGKGMMVHHLAQDAKNNNESCCVVLNNGGGQRGHTVELEDGTRHVFHHFGSGTLDGASTYMSKFFIINPTIFMEEYNDLINKFDISPKYYMENECIVSTPYDMLLNMYRNRNVNYHGTCGCGIWETILNQRADNVLTIEKCMQLSSAYFRTYIQFRQKIFEELVGEYYIKHLKDQGVDFDGLNDHWIRDLEHVCRLRSDKVPFSNYDVIILENGQGLELDYYKDYEFGTPSYTGLNGVIKFLNSHIDDYDLDVIFVTRSYLTRHGAGSFPETKEDNKFFEELNLVDKTNHQNDFQGKLRYAPLDFEYLYNKCCKEVSYYDNIQWSIAITHLNELKININESEREKYENKIDYVSYDKYHMLPFNNFIDNYEIWKLEE